MYPIAFTYIYSAPFLAVIYALLHNPLWNTHVYMDIRHIYAHMTTQTCSSFSARFSGESEQKQSEISKRMSVLNDMFDYFDVSKRFLIFDERNELNYPNAFNNVAE